MKNIVALIICLTLSGGCNQFIQQTDQIKNLTISDIAYDVDRSMGYTVYINENNILIPYLVLTGNYYGNVLLLRKFLLDESHLYNSDSGYYHGSLVDSFLNETFLTQINQELQKNITESEITITAESSLGICGLYTEQVKKKIFLLSCTEIGCEESTIACVEGIPLEYFVDDENRLIAYKQHEASSWWLRTSYTWYDCSAFGISPDGTVGGGGVYYENGVRPAFCLIPTTVIREDYLNGEKVYVISD